MMLGLGAAAGYALGGHGVSTMKTNMLGKAFEYDILIAHEKRQQHRIMNLAGYG